MGKSDSKKKKKDSHKSRKKDRIQKKETLSKEELLDQLKKLAKEHNKKEKKQERVEKSVVADDRTPMTKESYDKKRSTILTKYDPETGRIRKVRATGEVLETIVTRDQHQKINKMATMGDGIHYQSNLHRLN
ncbi:nuclear RNA-splicing-associated protein-domain-containing protein [Pilobolus umbonatus]|nr:nuclear RNA-splicing-associated protein-domain-containing protein [Pilobolus umbonatus]